MRYLSAAVLAGALLLSACGEEQRSPTSPPGEQPSAAISDGASSASGANKNFFFLPPLVPNPSAHPNFDAGRFNPTLKPVVEVCVQVDGAFYDAAGKCKQAPHRVFQGTEVAVDPVAELYQANWKTDEGRGLDATKLYRIRVLLGDTEIGFADVDPITRDQLKDPATGLGIPLIEGRTLPIKFRIEAGVLALAGYSAPDYVLRKVTNAGANVITEKQWAGAYFPAGWLDGVVINGQPLTEAYVVIERQYVTPDNKCHAGTYSLIEFEGCYKYNTFPDFGAQKFGKAVIVQNCPEITDKDPRYAALRHYKSDVGEPVAALEEAKVPFTLSCPIRDSQDPSFSTAMLDRVGTKLQWLASGLGKIFGVSPLYAVDLGAGGETFQFSNVGLGIERNISLVGGSATTAPSGTVIRVATRVWGAHSHLNDVTKAIETDTIPLVGEAVAFTASGGTLAGATTANTSGIATVDWTVPPGASTLTASVVGFDGQPRTVTVTINGTPTAPVPSFTVTGTISDVDDPTKVLSNGYGLLTVPTKGFVGNTTALNGVYTFSYGPPINLNWLAGEAGTLTASHPGYRSASEAFTIPGTTATLTRNFALKRVDLFHATSEKETVGAAPVKPEVGSWTIVKPATSQATVLVSGQQTCDGPCANPKRIEIAQPAGAGQAPDLLGTIVGQAPTTGVYSVKWTATVASASVGFAYVTVGSGIGAVEFRPGGVISYNTISGQDPVPLNATWTSGTLQSFELLVDVSNKRATLLVNGNAVVSNAGFLVPSATLNGINFNMGGTSAQVLSYDSVSISPVAGAPQ